MREFNPLGPAKELFFSFGKQAKSCTNLMGCMKVVSSWNINWMLLETVSMVFSGAQPDKWDREMDKVQEPISYKIIDATVNLLLSNVRSLKKHHEDVEPLLNFSKKSL